MQSSAWFIKTVKENCLAGIFPDVCWCISPWKYLNLLKEGKLVLSQLVNQMIVYFKGHLKRDWVIISAQARQFYLTILKIVMIL